MFTGAILLKKNLENTCPFESIGIMVGIVNSGTHKPQCNEGTPATINHCV